MKTYIILLPVRTFDIKWDAKKLAGQVFDDVKDIVHETTKDDKDLGEDGGVYEISDFMDMLNEEQLGRELSRYWMSYAYVK